MKGVLIEPCQHDTRSHAAAPVPTGDDTQKTISALISENARLGAELKESNRLVELFSGKHDAEVARAERERVLDIIRRTDAGACPYEQCHSGEGHDGLNCRDCLIKFVEDTPGSGGGKPQQQE